MSERVVVLATHNAHKVAEFQQMVAASIPGITVVGYDGPAPIEDGASFSDNALIKARAAARHTGEIALADDSGLCVDIMGGAPGIFSARWAGAAASDAANVSLLLAQLADVPDAHRSAAFQCTLALVVPDATTADSEFVVNGRWEGRLSTAVGGANGFGYDPIFIPEGHTITAAELAPEEKNRLSHRARAFAELVPILERFVQPMATEASRDANENGHHFS